VQRSHNARQIYTVHFHVGSGKSTLALSFFRFVEPTDGYISIDGIDITKVGLADLRNKLTIIPRSPHPFSLCTMYAHKEVAEDPTVLSGTLRSTLDVFDEYEDVEIVRVPIFSRRYLVHFQISLKPCAVCTCYPLKIWWNRA